jgi:ferredoxin
VKPGGKRHRLAVARIVVAGAVLVGFLYAFLAVGALSLRAATILARTQVFPSFLAMVVAGAGTAFFAWIVVLGATALFGRIYCSTLCPLGIFQDVVRWLFERIRRSRRCSHRSRPPLRALRYGILVVTVASALAGTMMIVDLIEPYRFFGMIVRDFVTPIVALASHGVFHLLKPFGIYLAPMVVPVDGFVFIVSFILTALLVVSVLLRGRWFCNTICPVGAALSVPASVSLFRVRIDPDACTTCGACERICRAGCIDPVSRSVDAGRCVGCFECLGVCHFDAIHYENVMSRRLGSGEGRSDRAAKPLSRRAFFRRLADGSRNTLAIFPLTFLLRRRASTPDGEPGTPAVPPGAGSVSRFSRLCVSCHLCVSRCPTGVLQPSLFEYGLSGLLQPTMDFTLGFCEYECNECSQVCPSGAILPVSLEAKKTTKIGDARFVRDRCVVVTNGTACGACAEVCPTAAVRMVPFGRDLTIPETNRSHCIGCGNCEYVCPVEPLPAIYVVGEATHGTARMPQGRGGGNGGGRRGGRASSGGEGEGEGEFPF